MSRASAAIFLMLVACGVTGQTQKGRERDVRAENYEDEAAFRRKTLIAPADIDAFIVTYAGTDAARRALIARQVDLQDAEGCSASVSYLARMEDALEGESAKLLRTEANVRRANLLLDVCNVPDAAVEAARLAVARAAGTFWADDADWVMGRACEKAGRADDALAAYDRIVTTLSSAIPFGSNDSLFLDDAWLAKGLLLEKLGRYREARDTLRELIDARDTHLRPKAEEALDRVVGK